MVKFLKDWYKPNFKSGIRGCLQKSRYPPKGQGRRIMRGSVLREIGRVLGIECLENASVMGYRIDSRKVVPGDLFFALKGMKNDGHDFLFEARSRGAIAAVVQSRYRGPHFGMTLFFVADVERALQVLAREFAKKHRAQRIGITGCLGKTTTKEFLATLLEAKFRVGKTFLSENTKLSFPLTLLNAGGEEEVWVLEMGMTEPEDLPRLLEIAPPDLAVLTKVARVHMENFVNLEALMRAKVQIFSHPRTKKALFPHELVGKIDLPEALEKKSFSLMEKDADYFLSKEGFLDEKGVRAFSFSLPFHAPHILHNFLAAVSAARMMRLSWDEIQGQVPLLTPPKSRFEVIEIGGITFVNDAYNAAPESMKAALAHLPTPKAGGKRIAVLGMMAEMGALHEEVHREVGEFAKTFIDHLIVFGKEAYPLFESFQEGKKPAEFFSDFSLLKRRLEELLCEGDVVLLKASRKVRLEELSLC